MLTYKNRNSFLQKLHPLTLVMLITFYIIGFLTVKNPIYVVLILTSLIALTLADGCFMDSLYYGKIVLPFALLIIILNPLMVHNGESIIYKGNINYPIIGYLNITLEAIAFGIFNGLRIICITFAFGFGNLIIHPDRTFGFFSKYIKKSSFLMSMTIRFFPTMMTSYKNISEVEKLRGNKVFKKGIKDRLKGYGSIVNILFLSSLEDAGDTAESMYSRGYGCGKRSSYFYEKLNIADYLLNVIVMVSIIYLTIFQNNGMNGFDFYPIVDNPLNIISINGFILCGTFFIPAIVNWGWKIWKR